jgi:hypothetical protein
MDTTDTDPIDTTTTTAPTSAPTVIVTPIPAASSRTLRLTKWLSWLSPVVAFIPDLVGIFLQMWMTNDAFADALMNAVPVQYKVFVATLIFSIAQIYGQLRRDTTAPIAGTKAAKRVMDDTYDDVDNV